MPTLGQCPPELIQAILHLLEQKELAIVCRVNRALHALCEPLLYTNLEWTWEDEDQPPPMLGLLETLLRRADLALSVRSFAVRGQNRHEHPRKNATVEVPESSFKAVDAAIDRLDNLCIHGRWMRLSQYYSIDILRSAWQQRVRWGSVLALLALLIAQMPNLTRLHLGENASRRTEWVGCVLRSSVVGSSENGLPRFKNLKRVTISPHLSDDHLPRDNLDDVMPLFYLSTLQSMTLRVEGLENFKWLESVSNPPALPSLTGLRLTSTCDQLLRHLLAATRVLKTLQYVSWRYLHTHEEYPYDLMNNALVDMSHIDSALALPQISQSVVHLSVTADFSSTTHEPEELELTNGPLKALRTFSKLRTLELSPLFAVGYGPSEDGDTRWSLESVIPTTVETVTFRGGLPYLVHRHWRPSEFVRQVEGWVTQEQHAPDLGLLRLGDCEDEWGRDIPCLREVCDAAGVDFEVFDVPVWYD